MNKCAVLTLVVIIGILLPICSEAQGLGGQLKGLRLVLEQLYEEMMPLCSQLIGVGRGIAGFAATWFIAHRVWGHIARAEPVDLYPLLRPFVIGFAVLIFPSVLNLINGVMKPTVTATSNMVQDSDKAIAVLLQQKEDAIRKTEAWQMYSGLDGSGDRDLWYRYQFGDESEGWFEKIRNDIKFAMAKASYSFKNSVKEWMSEVLQVLFQAASLCIDTIRTFYLVVLSILGPLVFGLSVFDGMGHTLTVWIARYINVFLWLPVGNIFGSIIGKVQEKMIALDISEVQSYGNTFFSSTDTAYLIFLVIGIIGYFTVPSVANYIVHAGGGNALLHKATSVFNSSASSSVHSVSSGAGMVADTMGNAAGRVRNSITTQGSNEGYFKDKLSGK